MKNYVLAALAICFFTVPAAAGQYPGTPYSGTPVSLPGTVQAENFDNGSEGVAYHDSGPNNMGGVYRTTGVDIESASGGGYDVAWVGAGEWTNYTVSVQSAGTYTITARVASPNGGSMHVGFNTASNVWQTVSVPNSGGWQNWTNVSFTATLGAGVQQLTLMSDTGGYNIDYVAVTSGGSSAPAPAPAPSTSTSSALSPFSGSPLVIPGTIQAEDFDNGGEGVAYHDTDTSNKGGAYRQTGVDLEAASGGGHDVGWFSAGEWLKYTVNVAAAGSYTVQVRVASPSGGSVHVGFGGASSVSQSVPVPATGAWQSWATVSFTATLGAGTQQMTLSSDTGGFNLDSVTVTSGSTSGPAPAPQPGSGSSGGVLLPVVEWNIQINDGSETHARLAMDMLLASGPRPEVIVIVEAYENWLSVYLDELKRQTGQTWYGAFATHCEPGQWNGSACNRAWYQGVGILSSHPITDKSSKLFPYADCWTSARAGLRATIDLNGLPVQVFATHLQTGGCANDAQSRYNSMRDLKAWASNYSTPQLAAGDFNADPDQIDTPQGMSPNFVDSWFVAGQGSRYTAFYPNPTMKIDYWFSDASGRATAQTSVVNSGVGGVSDHLPVEATFLVK